MILICKHCLNKFDHKANKPTDYCPEKECQQAKKDDLRIRRAEYQKEKNKEYRKLPDFKKSTRLQPSKGYLTRLAEEEKKEKKGKGLYSDSWKPSTI